MKVTGISFVLENVDRHVGRIMTGVAHDAVEYNVYCVAVLKNPLHMLTLFRYVQVTRESFFV